MVKTNWTTATTDVSRALMGLVSCLNAGKNAWLAIQKNGEQDFPITVSNPALEDPFNWTMAYGVPRNEEEMGRYRYLNDTERDLTYNWSAAFATARAAAVYQKTGEATRGLLKGMGVCVPVRNADLDALRTDGYKYGFWVTYWRPKDGISYRVAADISEVFVVCYDDAPVDKAAAYQKAGEFLLRLAAKQPGHGGKRASMRDGDEGGE